MSTFARHMILFLVAVVTIVLVDIQIYRKEMTMKTGQVMLLELAPVDPRSLMQGDYMVLRYKAANEVKGDSARDGSLVMLVEESGVASFRRVHSAAQPLGPGEHLLRYRKRGAGIRLGAESFFFQEGQGGVYRRARYGELRVAASGESLLTGLRGKDLERLRPESGQTAEMNEATQ